MYSTIFVSRSRSPPLQHPPRSQSGPTAGRTEAFEFEVGPARVPVLERPTAVSPLAATDDVDSFGEALVPRRVDGLEMVESAEDIVVPPPSILPRPRN